VAVLDGDGTRVLVVDDHADTTEILEAMLRMLGCETQAASRGEDVLRAAVELEPDLILLDVDLPDLDGYRVVELLRADARTRGCLIVAVTGWGRPEDVARAHAAGFDEHVLKPIRVDKVRLFLRGIARRRSAGTAC
jgi:two-component system CheB/CheR fusion protein